MDAEEFRVLAFGCWVFFGGGLGRREGRRKKKGIREKLVGLGRLKEKKKVKKRKKKGKRRRRRRNKEEKKRKKGLSGPWA